MKRYILIVIVLMIIMSACSTGAGKKSEAVSALEAYQTAFAAKDADQVSVLSCSDWEDQALLELDSFQAVDTKLEGLSCSETGTDGDATLVLCQGKILTTYGEEQREFDLSTRTFRMLLQNNEWLVCGVQ